jgi:hypothetical protein
MYYRCPVCNGSGLVEPNFGGVGNNETSKICPACKGTGMQFVEETKTITKIVEFQKIIEIPVPCKPKKKFPEPIFPQPPYFPRNPFFDPPNKKPYYDPFYPSNSPFKQPRRRDPLWCES